MVVLIPVSLHRQQVTMFSMISIVNSPNALINLPVIMPIPGIVEEEVTIVHVSIEWVSSPYTVTGEVSMMIVIVRICGEPNRRQVEGNCNL